MQKKLLHSLNVKLFDKFSHRQNRFKLPLRGKPTWLVRIRMEQSSGIAFKTADSAVILFDVQQREKKSSVFHFLEQSVTPKIVHIIPNKDGQKEMVDRSETTEISDTDSSEGDHISTANCAERSLSPERNVTEQSPIEIVDAEAHNDFLYYQHKVLAVMGAESDWHGMIENEDWTRLHGSLLNKQRESSCTSEGMLTHNSSLLHIAAWKAPSAIMLLLLEVMTSDPNSIARTKLYLLSGDADGNTPLHLACASLRPIGKDDFVITSSGNSIRPSMGVDFSVIKNLLLLAPECLELTNNDEDTPLHLLIASEAFHRNNTNLAVEAAAEEAIASLLNMAPHLALVQNDGGCTLLHVALANRCHERVLIQLMTKAKDSITVADRRGMLPLHYVAALGAIPFNVANYLVEENPDSICCQNEQGDTPLHLLVMNTNCALQERWERQLNVDPSSSQPFYHVDRQTMKLVELLIGTGVEEYSPLLIQNDEDMTPLHCCASYDTPVQLTRILMSHCKPDLVAKASAIAMEASGATALHLAILELDEGPSSSLENKYIDEKKQNAVDNIKALNSAQACAVLDAKERSPLVLALQRKKISSDVVKTLIAKFPESVYTRTSKKALPIHFACQNRKVSVQIIKALLNAYPIGVNCLTSRMNTPLHEACKHGVSASVIEFLIDIYPDAIDQRNSKGELPVDRARKNGAKASLIQLLEKTTMQIEKAFQFKDNPTA